MQKTMKFRTRSPEKIRSLNLDEYWLQDYICQNPTCLGLGEVDVVYKERRQTGGGRLDILLRSMDGEEFFEVEVMLGETDESHIIRTVEYWDNERKKFPKRQHTAVLVAEKINSRFYNVINLLSNAVPIIGIQVNAYKEGEDTVDLVFTKIIDSYQEPELPEVEGSGVSVVVEHPYVREIGNVISELMKAIDPQITESVLRWGLSYFNHEGRVVRIIKRGFGKVSIEITAEEANQEACLVIARDATINCDNNSQRIRLWMSLDEVKQKRAALSSIFKVVCEKQNA